MASSRPTVYDVAQRAGVSIATVSFAFRRPDKVREDTRRVVLEAAREIGYVPSGSARSLARGRTGVLGLHLFDMLLDEEPGATPSTRGAARIDGDEIDLDADPVVWDASADERESDPRTFPLYVDEVQRGFVLECKRHGTAVLLSSGGVGVSDLADTAGRVDGLAILPGRSTAAAIEAVAARVPVVQLSKRAGIGHRVTVDNAGGMRMLVAHLHEQHGARTFGWVGAIGEDDLDERREGFLAAVQGIGGAEAETLDDTDLERIPAYPVLRERAGAGTLPDALVCGSDQTALRVMDVLRGEGIGVPGDVLVTGFDGILASRLSSPALTTVRQPMELMGRIAARLLLTDPGDGSAPARTVRLATELRIGGSCGC